MMTPIQSKKWNLWKVILIGAVIGALYSAYGVLTEDWEIRFGALPKSQHFSAAFGEVIGGTVGGAFLFGLVALIRNYFGPK